MTVLFDTSLLVAALVEDHPAHARALAWLQVVHGGTVSGVVSAHSLAEVYAVLTRLPHQPRIAPAVAWQLIGENIIPHFEIISLCSADYADLIRALADLGIAGGATYDAIILHAAAKAGADQILTLNEADFRRVRPDLVDRIVSA